MKIRTSKDLGWWMAFLRDALLVLGLSLALVTLDSPHTLWARWWALALSVVCGLMCLVRSGGLVAAWPHLGWAGFLFGLLAVRAVASLSGPLPADGLREAQDLAVIYMGTLALWLVGRVSFRRALICWTLALGMGAAAAVVARQHPLSLDAPFWVFCITFPLAVAVTAVRLFTPLAHYQFPRPVAALGGLTALSAGAVAGWGFYMHHHRLALDVWMAVWRGVQAQKQLWCQSVLLGWGHGPLEKLAQMTARPQPVVLSTWSGPYGTLALGGLAGALVLGVLALVLLARVRRVQTSSVATACALFVLGLVAVGGTQSAAILMILAGWLALAWVPKRRYLAEQQNWVGVYVLQLCTWSGFMALVVIMLMGVGLPMLGRSRLGEASSRAVPYAQAIPQLERAMRLNPWDPALPMALAARQREAMSQLDGWNQSYYERINLLYQRAMRLDPSNTLIPMKWGNFQLTCKRPNEALETVEMALREQPNSTDLMVWLHQVALRLDRTPLAYRMVEQGMRVDPRQAAWWVRRMTLSRRSGQTPQERRALEVALTATPDWGWLVRRGWMASQSETQPPAGPTPGSQM